MGSNIVHHRLTLRDVGDRQVPSGSSSARCTRGVAGVEAVGERFTGLSKGRLSNRVVGARSVEDEGDGRVGRRVNKLGAEEQSAAGTVVADMNLRRTVLVRLDMTGNE